MRPTEYTGEILLRVREFLDSRGEEEFFEVAPPDVLMGVFTQAGGELEEDGPETNGWELDWWISGTYKDTQYQLSGSAWYGNGRIRVEDL